MNERPTDPPTTINKAIGDRALTNFELWFRPLSHEGRGLAFPCDPAGRVDLDAVSERTRNNYLFARAMVGRDYTPPVVQQLQQP